MRNPVMHKKGNMWVGEEIGCFSGGGRRGHDYLRSGEVRRGGEVGVVH